MLVPARLLLPPLLAERWPAVVARDGFVVSRDGRKAVLACGSRSLVMHFDESAVNTVCDLSLVTDRETRRRIEAIFLSSGASLEDWSFITTHVRALYRIDDEGWLRFGERLAAEGIRIDASMRPLCPDGDPFPAGRVRHGGASLHFETGPALSPEEAPARFIDLLPRFLIAPRHSLRSLIDRCHTHLIEVGAVSVYRFSSPA